MKGQIDFSKVTRFLGGKAGKTIKNKAVPFTLLCIMGILVTLGTPAIPFLGLPALRLPWLGTALILWAFHGLFPSESKVMEGTERFWCGFCKKYVSAITVEGKKVCPRCEEPLKAEWAERHIGLENWGPMYAKSFIKLLAITCLIIQAFVLNVLLLAVAIAFIAYFSLPTRYKKTQPYKAAEAWFRMALGVVFAALLTIFLTPNPDALFSAAVLVPILITIPIALAMVVMQVSTKRAVITVITGLIIIVIFNALFISLARVPSLAIFYLTIAFFATTPVREKTEETVVQVNVIADKISSWIDKQEAQWEAIGTGIFLAFAIMAGIPILGSWLAGAAGEIRWIVGLVWLMSLFAGSVGGREGRPYIGAIMLTFAILAFSFAYTDTVGTAVFGPWWGTVEAAGETFFGPIAEGMDRANCEAWATWVCVREGPVACSEARLKCRVTISEAKGAQTAIEFSGFKVEPGEYHIGEENTIYFELANNGDYDATDVMLEVPEENGKVKRVVGVEKEVKVGTVLMDDSSCIGGEYIGENKCKWPGAMPKGGKGAALITIKWNKATSADAGLFPEVLFKASYDYTVYSNYKVDVRSSDEMRRLLLAGETIAGEVAQFSGGPVTAGLWTPKYIESGKETLVIASLTNTKRGTAEKPVYCVYVPEEAYVSDLSQHASFDFGGTCPEKPGMQAVRCDWDKIPKVGEVDPETAKPLNTKSCSFKISIDIGTAPQKQLAIIGEANYHYVVEHIKKDIMLTKGLG